MFHFKICQKMAQININVSTNTLKEYLKCQIFCILFDRICHHLFCIQPPAPTPPTHMETAPSVAAKRRFFAKQPPRLQEI